MTLQVLRNRIGDRAFFTVLKTWAAQHRYGNATTAQFIALAERVSHRDLDGLFRAWLYTPGKPGFTR
jgi:aminopeptidase N